MTNNYEDHEGNQYYGYYIDSILFEPSKHRGVSGYLLLCHGVGPIFVSAAWNIRHKPEAGDFVYQDSQADGGYNLLRRGTKELQAVLA